MRISNSLGRNDNFLAKARKLSILPTSLDIFLYTAILCMYSLFTPTCMCPFTMSYVLQYLPDYMTVENIYKFAQYYKTRKIICMKAMF